MKLVIRTIHILGVTEENACDLVNPVVCKELISETIEGDRKRKTVWSPGLCLETSKKTLEPLFPSPFCLWLGSH
jgi:hypothetical protein